MRLLIGILFCFVGNFALASAFDGTWSGTGKVETSSWGSFSASPVVIEIKQNGTVLSSKDCWSFVKDGANWRICSSRDLDMKGSELWYQGHRVGSLSPSRIEINYNVGGNLIESVVELQANGTLDFKYQAADSTGFVRNEALGLIR